MDRQIGFDWRRLERSLTGDPIKDKREFWQKQDSQTGGYVEFSPRLPWPDDTIVRTVRDPYRPARILHRCIAQGITVLWSQVRAWFLAEANLELPETPTVATPIRGLIEKLGAAPPGKEQG